jgi:hypothetical protein
MLPDPTAWALTLLGRPPISNPAPNAVGLNALLTWMRAEGGWWGNAARYNPLNTTWPMPGSYPINPERVQAYPSLESGYEATTRTLAQNGYGYPAVVACLRANAGCALLARAVGASEWGTGDFSSDCGPVPPNPLPPSPAPGAPADILAMVTATPEFTVRFLYRMCLHREPDAAGYADWVAKLNAGMNPSDVMAGIQDSPEGVAALTAERRLLGLS